MFILTYSYKSHCIHVNHAKEGDQFETRYYWSKIIVHQNLYNFIFYKFTVFLHFAKQFFTLLGSFKFKIRWYIVNHKNKFSPFHRVFELMCCSLQRWYNRSFCFLKRKFPEFFDFIFFSYINIRNKLKIALADGSNDELSRGSSFFFFL